jgi:hypothetical protein
MKFNKNVLVFSLFACAISNTHSAQDNINDRNPLKYNTQRSYQSIDRKKLIEKYTELDMHNKDFLSKIMNNHEKSENIKHEGKILIASMDEEDKNYYEIFDFFREKFLPEENILKLLNVSPEDFIKNIDAYKNEFNLLEETFYEYSNNLDESKEFILHKANFVYHVNNMKKTFNEIDEIFYKLKS